MAPVSRGRYRPSTLPMTACPHGLIAAGRDAKEIHDRELVLERLARRPGHGCDL